MGSILPEKAKKMRGSILKKILAYDEDCQIKESIIFISLFNKIRTAGYKEQCRSK